MDKEALLARLTADWDGLVQALEGVPHEEFTRPTADDGQTVKEICAFLTAWDGEALRRIDLATGRSVTPRPDVHNRAYWEAWGAEQVTIKGVMAVQGLLVDMISTRQRLLARIAELADFHLERWLAEDPQATQAYYADYVRRVQVWRAAWEEAPAQTGRLTKLRRLFGKRT